MNDASSEIQARRRGALAALVAFTIWGLAPLYFKAVGSVPPFEIVAHRVLWSLVFLTALLAFWRGLRRLWRLRRGHGCRAARADVVLTGS